MKKVGKHMKIILCVIGAVLILIGAFFMMGLYAIYSAAKFMDESGRY